MASTMNEALTHHEGVPYLLCRYLEIVVDCKVNLNECLNECIQLLFSGITTIS